MLYYGAILQVFPVDEAPHLASLIRSVCSEADKCEETRVSGFEGNQLADIILALGSSGVVLAVARVLTAWLDERKNRTVKLNGKELRGYSAKEVANILRASKITSRKSPK